MAWLVVAKDAWKVRLGPSNVAMVHAHWCWKNIIMQICMHAQLDNRRSHPDWWFHQCLAYMVQIPCMNSTWKYVHVSEPLGPLKNLACAPCFTAFPHPFAIFRTFRRGIEIAPGTRTKLQGETGHLGLSINAPYYIHIYIYMDPSCSHELTTHFFLGNIHIYIYTSIVAVFV